jgi:hypothetical protein
MFRLVKGDPPLSLIDTIGDAEETWVASRCQTLQGRFNMILVRRLALALVLSTSLVSVTFVESSAAAERQDQESSLRLRRWSIRTDDHGRKVLKVSIGNYGSRPVNIKGMCATSDGIFYGVYRDIDAGKVLDWAIAVKDEPAFVTVDTSEGQVRMELLPEK